MPPRQYNVQVKTEVLVRQVFAVKIGQAADSARSHAWSLLAATINALNGAALRRADGARVVFFAMEVGDTLPRDWQGASYETVEVDARDQGRGRIQLAVRSFNNVGGQRVIDVRSRGVEAEIRGLAHSAAQAIRTAAAQNTRARAR